MSQNEIQVKVFRKDSATGGKASFDLFQVPFETGMSVMDALDYIYQNQDSTIAYYDHAGCALGICARCLGKVNGKACLMCQTMVEGDLVIEPVNEKKVVKDLVCRRGRSQS